MRRRQVIRRGAALGTIGLAGCTSGGPDAGFTDGFEEGMDGWESDAAIGPEVDLAEFEWETSVSEAEAATGDRSVLIRNEGDYDDGVTWITHQVSVPSGTRFQVTVTAQFWSESESFNTLRNAVMRLGPEPPDVEEDFPDPGVNTTPLGETPYGGLREPLHLTEGWREYTFGWTTPKLSVDTLYLSLGTAVVWETEATHYIDDVSVAFEAQ